MQSYKNVNDMNLFTPVTLETLRPESHCDELGIVRSWQELLLPTDRCQHQLVVHSDRVDSTSRDLERTDARLQSHQTLSAETASRHFFGFYLTLNTALRQGTHLGHFSLNPYIFIIF